MMLRALRSAFHLGAVLLALVVLGGRASAQATHTIRGRVVCGIFGFGISGIKMYGLPGDPRTDGDGYYTATVPAGWSGAVYPVKSGLHFDPFGRNYTNVTTDLVHNYKTTLPVPAISGYVKTAAGDPVSLVAMTGLPKTPLTNSHGFYLAYVSSGASPTVVPQKEGNTFTPPSRAYSDVDGDMENQNYTANSAPAILVSPTSGLVTTENGGTAVFTVVLNSQPTADVTIGITSLDTSEGTVAPASLTFTPANWSTPQAVTVTGQDDGVRDGNVAYTIRTEAAVSADPAYNGQNPPDVSVTNLDNDTPGILVSPTSGLVTTENGGTAQFTVVLLSRPSSNVTIPILSDDATEGVASPSSLTFTPANWDVPQTVTVTGVDDLPRDGDRQYTIKTGKASSADPGYNGLKADDVTVTNLDNDGPPVLSVEPVGTVAFPATEIGQFVELPAFTVTNAGGGFLTGTASVTGAFTIVAGGTFALLTGESKVVGIRFAPPSAGNYQATVSFNTNGGIASRTVSGTGIVHTVIVDNLDDEAGKRFEIVAGTWASDTTRTKSWNGDYRTAPTGGGSVAAWVFRVKYDGLYEVAAWWPKPLDTWASAAPFTIHHVAGATQVPKDQRSSGGQWNLLGKFEFWSDMDWRVELSNASLGSTVVADAVRVRWVGALKPKLAVAPKGLTDFGPTRIGTPRELDAYVVTNAGKGRLIGTVSVPAPFGIISGGTFALGAGASQVVRIGYAPAAEGAHTAIASFISNGGSTTRSVRGTGYFVLPPLLAVEPAGDVDFGEVLVGRTVEQDAFTVRNEGDQPISGTAAVGGVFSIVAGGTFNLNPGDSQAVRIRFAPAAEAAYSQTVTFTSNGGTATRKVLGKGAWLVVDNQDNAPDRRFVVTSGTWTPTTARPKFWAADYCFTTAGDGSSVAAWYFQVPADGVYEVAAWWPRALATWGSSVPFTIHHRNGSSLVNMAQTSKGGKWNLLGTYEFPAGTEWRVEIANNTPGLFVVADAIRLKRIGPLPLLKGQGGIVLRRGAGGTDLPPGCGEQDAAAQPPMQQLAILATPEGGPAPLDVLFEALGAPAGSKCTWEFGDGASGQGVWVMHTFYSPGTYIVRLSAGGASAQAAIVVAGGW